VSEPIGGDVTEGRILVVEDDPKTADTLRRYLEHGGFSVEVAFNGTQALEDFGREPPDLVVLDLMLPRIDGLEVCRRIRARSRVPIIMLTARTTEEDRLRGLEGGADDYVAKPFSPRELVARVRVVLRRVREAPLGDPLLRAGDLELDPAARVARRAGRALALTPREFQLLETLMRAPDRAFTRGALVEAAFGGDSESLERTVDVHVMNLRRKVEDDPSAPRFVRTVFGVGYRFASRPEEE
jgi:DNA-binding response OmpR family regulator